MNPGITKYRNIKMEMTTLRYGKVPTKEGKNLMKVIGDCIKAGGHVEAKTSFRKDIYDLPQPSMEQSRRARQERNVSNHDQFMDATLYWPQAEMDI